MEFQSLFRRKTTSGLPEEGGDGYLQDGLHKVLNVRDLTFFGIAAIIGAGSFSSMGEACYSGGPGVIFLFIICAIACGFTALCYAEFASRVKGGGSAYTYAYVTFGELFAWIIGWALLMEYSIGNIYVAFSWSGYFTSLLDALGWHIPEWLSINYRAAHEAFLTQTPGRGLVAWQQSPVIGQLHLVLDLPALMINTLITWLVYVGIKESRNLSNGVVVVKLLIILLVLVVGAFYVDIANWTPFAPNGFGGIMKGVSAVFFAYIGFDAISTLSEEAKNPQRDLPRGMIYSLIVCTILYILLSLVLTGMVSFKSLGVNDPLAEVFKLRQVKWMLFIISIAAVFAMTSVLLVFQMGQPRIWLSMSRDGLLPKKFSSIHPKFKTPDFATIITGLVVGVPILFTDEKFVLDFTSIGTLFAFLLVCGGVLLLPPKTPTPNTFNLPYINGKYIYPVGLAIGYGFIFYFYPNWLNTTPLLVFFIFSLGLGVFTFIRNFSLIPVLGLFSCSYLLTGMGSTNWIWFLSWLLLGLVIYFSYSRKRSKLNV